MEKVTKFALVAEDFKVAKTRKLAMPNGDIKAVKGSYLYEGVTLSGEKQKHVIVPNVKGELLEFFYRVLYLDSMDGEFLHLVYVDNEDGTMECEDTSALLTSLEEAIERVNERLNDLDEEEDDTEELPEEEDDTEEMPEEDEEELAAEEEGEEPAEEKEAAEEPAKPAYKGAKKVGDIHKNGKWVWTEYQTGKFDWRVIKNK